MCDAFDARTSRREHGASISAEAAIEEIRRHSGTQFDATVVDAFDQTLVLSQPGAGD